MLNRSTTSEVAAASSSEVSSVDATGKKNMTEELVAETEPKETKDDQADKVDEVDDKDDKGDKASEKNSEAEASKEKGPAAPNPRTHHHARTPPPRDNSTEAKEVEKP